MAYTSDKGDRKVAKAQSVRFLTYLAVSACTAASLAGCGSLASASTQKPVRAHIHAIRRHTVRSPFQPVSLSFTLLGYRGRGAGTPSPISLQNARETTGDVITVGGAHYEFALTSGAALMYVPTPRGIVWTVVPANVRDPEAADGLYGKIYLTPYSFLSLKRRSFSLAGAAQIIYQAPVYKVGKNRFESRLQLYQFEEGALFSQTQPFGTAPHAIRYIAAPFSGVPVTLFSATTNSGPPALLGPFGGGVLYSTSLSDKKQSDRRAIIYSNFSSGRKVTLIPKYSQFSAVAQHGVALIMAGSQTFAIAANGRVTQSLTPANPGLLSAQRALHAVSLPKLYLPAVDLTAHAGQTVTGTLRTTAVGQYQITLFGKGGQPICLATVTAQKQQEAAPEVPQGKPHANGPFAISLTNRRSQPTIPDFFGKQRPLHTFILQSAEGPFIQWIQSDQHPSGTTHWYASFDLQSWRYVIGPFTNLAIPTQTKLLSQFIKLMIHSGPPFDTGGQIYVHLQRAGRAYAYGASEVSFFPSPGVHVRMDSSGLESLQQVARFTLLSP